MNIKISVLLCTYRFGGISISLEGLARQTFPRNDFEVILCDRWYEERKDAVKELNEQYEVPLIHVKPIRQQFPLSSGSMQRNSAICEASGELLIFLCDYALCQPDWLQRHWNCYDPERMTTGMGPHRYRVHPPELKENWEKEYISIFKEELTPDKIMNLPIQPAGQDPKLERGGGPIGGDYFHMKNEAFMTSTALAINGCDEGFDNQGGHAYSDMDYGQRINNAGGTFLLDPSNIIEIIQIRDIYPLLQRNRDTGEDYNYYIGRKGQWENNTSLLPAPNGYSLKELREEILRKRYA